MSGFLRKIRIFIIFVVCFACGASRAVTTYTDTLNPNDGDANPNYLSQVCKLSGQYGRARPLANNTCPTDSSAYSTTFTLTQSELPQKYANHTDATDGYETFLGYGAVNYTSSVNISAEGVYSNTGGSSGNTILFAWWQGATNVTPFTVNYYDGNTLVDTQSCTFGDSTGCDVLSPVGIVTAPAGKYFDGWHCKSVNGTSNCRTNRYLPPNYASLSTPITPYGSSAISNWPDTSSRTRYLTDLRDASGNVVTNMSYEYTGENTINLYASYAPYTITVNCYTSAISPFIGSNRTQSTYLDNNNVQHDIVYGSVIPLEKNFGDMCKSVYYEYDVANGNDQWCSEYLDNDSYIDGYIATNSTAGEIMTGSNQTNLPYTRLGDSSVRVSGTCSRFTLNYSCGSFEGNAVGGEAPNVRYTVGSNGIINRYLNPDTTGYSRSISYRGYPEPAYPYPQTNNGVCGTYTLTPTSGATAGVPRTFGDVSASTATDMGYGCCEKPQYAEFKGYQVRRNNANGELLNNGNLIQPGQYGASNCNVSFDNNTDPDTWTPGCDLWPWKGGVYLTAIWEHTPIQVTFNNNGADNAANLLGTAYLKYGEGFYLYSTSSGYTGQITQLSPLPQKAGYIFGGYQYCDANDVCTMVVGADGAFISGENNLKFTDTDITATAVWTIDEKFTVTTTNLTLDTTTNTVVFRFNMSAAGTFYVDCGDDGTLSGTGVSGNTIARTNDTTLAQYTCTYTSGGVKTIRFGGLADDYSNDDSQDGAAIQFYNTSSSGMTPTLVAGISGSLGAIFPTLPSANVTQPRFYRTFSDCTNLVGAIPSTLFNGISGTPTASMFAGTFMGCTNLGRDTVGGTPTYGIPSNLFSGISGAPAQSMFFNTFLDCTGLTGAIPSNLFGGISGAPAQNMFQRTFSGCTGLTGSIPSGLFGGISGAPAHTMFSETFYGCTGLTGSIPSGLFGGISGAPAENMFYQTFYGCSGLTGSIPSGLFGSISGTSADRIFYQTFYGCTNLGRDTVGGTPTYSIPSGLFGSISGAPEDAMFQETFYNCSGLAGPIPSGLFGSMSGTASGRIFYGTFNGCSGLTGSIPAGLFGNLSGSNRMVFPYVFNGCTNLTGYVPKDMFENLTNNRVATNAFTGTNLWTTCPCGTKPAQTGWGATTADSRAVCEVGLKSGEHWSNGVCTTDCELGFTQLKTSGGLAYTLLADATGDHNIYVANGGNSACHVPLVSGASSNAINVSLGGTIYHASMPDETAPVGFTGQPD